MMRPLALDLFCGACGGWSLGMHRAGFDTIAACEIDPWRRAMFSQNFPSVRMYDDVRSLSASRIVSDLGRLPDIIVGSPPCQDASTANTKGRGVDGERTGLFFEAIRLIREIRPRWVALENVAGLRTRGADRVLGSLEEIGYSAWPFLVGADDIGANHARKRVWIIAFDPAQIGCDGGRAWRRGPDGDCAAYPSQGDRGTLPDADQKRYPHGSLVAGLRQAQEPDDGCAAGWGATGIAPDADGDGWPSGWRRDGSGLDILSAEGVGRAADANDTGDAPQVGRGTGRPRGCAGADAELSERAFEPNAGEMGGRSSLGGDAGEPWAGWNGGLASHLRVDARLSTKLADERGIAGQIVSAFGDAVVPQITESIGRAIWRVERAYALAAGLSRNDAAE